MLSICLKNVQSEPGCAYKRYALCDIDYPLTVKLLLVIRIYYHFKSTWSFSIFIDVHVQNNGTQKSLLRRWNCENVKRASILGETRTFQQKTCFLLRFISIGKQIKLRKSVSPLQPLSTCFWALFVR